MSIIIFLVILLVLILVHEFGHFFSAKKFGIRVDEFGFGFPPKLFSKKYGETEYSFNALPFGGFVKIFGESPEAESISGPDSNRSFVNKPKWQQAIVLFAGVFANFLLAWFLFSFAFMSGFPMSASSEVKNASLRDVQLTIISVLPESPAKQAGLVPGDKILFARSGENELLEATPENLKSFIVAHSGREIELGYLRHSEENVRVLALTPAQAPGETAPMIGIAMDMVGIAKLPVWQGFVQGMRFTVFVVKNTVSGLYTLIKEALLGRGSLESVTGPVGLVGIIGNAYQFGFTYLLSFTALISVNLAIINLIPFPALDGGRLFFLLIEKIKGSPINHKAANMANTVGFALLILLMLAVTYNDIVKLL